MVDLSRNLRGLILSANELQAMTQWPDELIEDYLSIFENFIILSDTSDGKIDVIDPATDGNLPQMDSDGQLEDSGESVQTLKARSYFYGRHF